MDGMAYGAGKAGGAFDPQTFFRQPHTILRMVSWAGQAFLAFQRYKLGADSALFSQDYTDPSQDATVPYSAYVGGEDLESPPNPGSYQQSNTETFDSTAGYQRQDY
nr:PREDICTED: synaptogyrin-1 [Lepisosteus oculatus]